MASIGKTNDKSLPRRPGYGTQGRKVVLWANYFELKAPRDTAVFRYSIEIKAEQSDRAIPGKLAKRVIQLLIEDHLKPMGHDVFSDFRTTLISRSSIDLTTDIFHVVYRAEEEDEPPENPKRYLVRIQQSGTLSLAGLLDYSTSTSISSLYDTKQEVIQALNIIIGHHPKTQPTTLTVGKRIHTSTTADQANRTSLGAGLEALRAFAFSARAATERILVNVQIKNLPFYETGPLQVVVGRFSDYNRPSPSILATFLKRLSIELTHIKKVNRKGKRIPRYKTIIGLATTADGRGLAHPPKIASYGAGPKDVQFWLEEDGSSSSKPAASEQPGSGKDKKKKQDKAEPTQTKGRYISVLDFFRQRE